MTHPISSLDLPTLSRAEWNRIQETSRTEPDFDCSVLEDLDWYQISQSEDGNVSLGGKAFLFFWNDYYRKRDESILERLHCQYGITCLSFLGFALNDPDGKPYVPCMCWDGVWYPSCYEAK